VAVPLAASVLSAWGMLNTDLRVELSRGQGQSGALDTSGLRAAFAGMEAEGRARLAWFDGALALRRAADMRYGEQVFEIPVPLDDLDWDAPDLSATLAERFHAAHENLYTYALRDQEVVLVNARLSVIGRLAAVERATAAAASTPAAPKSQRRIYLSGWTQVPVFDFPALSGEQRIAGPAIVESDTTTVLLRAGDAAYFDPRGWLDITVGGDVSSGGELVDQAPSAA
jgi:N-methylhydantoinase A